MIYEAFLIKSWSSFSTFTVLPAYFILHNHAQMQKYSSWTCCCSSAGSWAQSERNSYCAPDYPVVSWNTSLHFNRLSPFMSPWEVEESGEGGKEPFCGSPQLWRNFRSYQHAAASNNGKYTGLWASCKLVHVGKITSLRHLSQKPALSIFPQSWNNEFLYRLLNPSSLHSLEGKVPLSLRH